MCAWLFLLCSEAYCGDGPRLEPLRATPPTYNEIGFDVSYESQTYPSLDVALQDCREGRVWQAVCIAKQVFSIGGYDFISFVASWNEDGRPMMSTELLAREITSGKTWSLFSVAIETGFGTTGHIEYFMSPAGTLLRVPVQLSGTGAFNKHFHFLWHNGLWQEIDTQGWLRTVRLTPGHGIWKGVVVDLQAFTARSSVWRDGDGNCCPSGGEVEVKLTLKGRTLVIESQAYHPPPLK